VKNLSEKLELVIRASRELGSAIILSFAPTGVKDEVLTEYMREIKSKEGDCFLNYLDSGSSLYIITANIDIRSWIKNS
tara:strand:+ start:343 stop:576 length:234 start_codon:yes stop_codon:yes gene_type:complete